MKKLYIVLIACISPFVESCGQNAQLLLEEGFESGKLELKASSDGIAPDVISSSDAKAGDYVMISRLTPESDVKHRAEVSLNKDGLLFEVDQEYWVGLSTKLDNNFTEVTGFNDQGMLMQWHYFNWLRPEVKDAQPLVIRYEDAQIKVQCEMLSPREMAFTTPNIGEWIDWVIHVKFSDNDGFFEVWKNGDQILDWSGDNHIVEMVEGAYMKFGIYSAQYKRNPMPPTASRTIYHDELRIAGENGSYEMVMPQGK